LNPNLDKPELRIGSRQVETSSGRSIPTCRLDGIRRLSRLKNGF